MHFNFDNKLFQVLSKLMDAVILSGAWFICCIPIFTIGASSTALYYAVHKSLHRNRGYILSTFWRSFKENFKQSTLVWLIQLGIGLLLAGDIYITWQLFQAGSSFGKLVYVFVVIACIALVWLLYTIAYEARFANTVKNTLKNAGVISFANLPWSLLVFVLFVCTVILIIYVPVLMFLMPALLALSYDMILEKIFRQYMRPEDLAAEEENDKLDFE